MGANYSQEQMLGERPQLVYCKTCNEARLTKVEYLDKPNRGNWCICLTISWMFLIPCILVPIFLNDEKLLELVIPPMAFFGVVSFIVCIVVFVQKDIKHYCTHCETYIGKFNPYNR
ncbi:hypothetical protein Mgra_00005663 [Meloidogyne graminicola]|uniref:LITAF domain-containing protein n=1 Tax=Meloidogyne graminicola TaxID=189291 RepID=A0A8S9ZND2_9BILA|nr:hypothetical protein Mgra_00005663 [Meloidogyne graminicola]